MNKEKDLLYLAGRLFSESDQRQRTFEKFALVKFCGDNIEVFSPLHDNPSNDKSTLPTAENIFINDTEQIIKSRYIFAELDGEDAGVMAELGIAWGINFMLEKLKQILKLESIEDICQSVYNLTYNIPEKEVITHLTDIRVGTAGEYDSRYVPYGYNQYVIGMIESMNSTIHNSTSEAIESLKNRI